jgi:hypothetical protein
VRQDFTCAFPNPHFSWLQPTCGLPNCQLQNLFEACDVDEVSDASFGTLQPAHFSSNFNLELSGLLQALQPLLLDGDLEKQGIEAELCELNVYGTPLDLSEVYEFQLERVLAGKGSRSEGVKNTLVNERMFASLIVSFPTHYDGGDMLLRHLEDEYSVVSQNKLNDSSSACIAYAAYFCDVERTVSPIISGYYVSLKYNLYLRGPFVYPGPSSSITCTTWNELAFREKLSKLLSDPLFLPAGGKLGFSLLNHYPISVHQTDSPPVSSALPPLRGIDAVIKRVCEEFSLLVTPCIVYNTSRALMMSDKVYPHEFTEWDSKLLLENGHYILEWSDVPVWPTTDLDWVFELRSFGNDNVSWVPGGLCLCVNVGPAQKRDEVLDVPTLYALINC